MSYHGNYPIGGDDPQNAPLEDDRDDEQVAYDERDAVWNEDLAIEHEEGLQERAIERDNERW
jgi:hypothetical protein